jgi:hypothetical protein
MSTTTPTTTTNNSYSNLNNKPICDAFGCSSGATETINVNGGIYGTITLSLCSPCKNKFKRGN